MNIKDKQYISTIKKKITEMNANGKMTVVYFLDSYFPIIDGVVSMQHNYATHLKDKINVIVCVPAHKEEQVDQEYTVISCKSFYFAPAHYDCALPSGDKRLKELLSAARIDLVHIQSPFLLGAYGLKLAKERNIPVIATFHSQYKKDFLNYTHSKRIAAMLLNKVMKVFNGADCVYTMHEFSRQTLISYGYKGAIRLLPNAANDKPAENPAELIAMANDRFDIADKKNVLLFVGRLTKVKNIFFIVEVLKVLKERNFPFHMLMVGDGPDGKQLKKRATANGLKDDITFTGGVYDKKLLQGLYLRSDLFLFPSCYDVSSIAQIEAAAQNLCGLFVKGSVTSCTIEDNVNGFLCDENVDAFADRIEEIFSDREKLKLASDQAYKTLYLSWDTLTERILREYGDIIKQHDDKNQGQPTNKD